MIFLVRLLIYLHIITNIQGLEVVEISLSLFLSLL
jgi:hypothetical protein